MKVWVSRSGYEIHFTLHTTKEKAMAQGSAKSKPEDWFQEGDAFNYMPEGEIEPIWIVYPVEVQ